MFEDLDLTAIQDENARQLIVRLLNLIENLTANLPKAYSAGGASRDSAFAR